MSEGFGGWWEGWRGREMVRRDDALHAILRE